MFCFHGKKWYIKADIFFSLHCPSWEYSTLSKTRLETLNWFGVLVFNYLNISIRGWSSKMKIRANIYHYLSWLITLDLLNTCIRTFGLWKNCQILFESWNIIMFLYPKLLFVLKILKRVLIKIWYSICYKPVCLSKHINLQNSYSLPLNIQPNILNLFR